MNQVETKEKTRERLWDSYSRYYGDIRNMAICEGSLESGERVEEFTEAVKRAVDYQMSLRFPE